LRTPDRSRPPTAQKRKRKKRKKIAALRQKKGGEEKIQPLRGYQIPAVGGTQKDTACSPRRPMKKEKGSRGGAKNKRLPK
jgi:hypothetical protein